MDASFRHPLLRFSHSTCWLLLILALPATAVCIAEDDRDRAVSESDNVLVDVRAVPDSLGALYTVKCFDEERNFFIDTGASCTLLDTSLRLKLGDPIGNVKTTAGTKTEVFAAPKLELAGVVLDSEESVSGDLRQISEAVGHHVAGVVGMDALSQYVLELDLAGERLRLYREVPEETRQKGDRLKIRADDGGSWFVSAMLPDGEEDFLLDTGSDCAVVLAQDRFKPLRKAKSIRYCSNCSLHTFYGEEMRTRGELSSLTLGTHEHEELSVLSSRLTNPYSQLGRSYLRRFVVTFDFREGSLYLRPSSDYRAGDPHRNRSGLDFWTLDKQTYVFCVEKGSPAHNAGLQPADRIVCIRGRNAEGLSEGRLHAILSRDGEEVEIVASRNGKDFACKIKLRDFAMHTKDDKATSRSPADSIPR